MSCRHGLRRRGRTRAVHRLSAVGADHARDDAACGDLGGDLIEVAGPFPGDPVLVGREWVDGFVRDRASTSRGTARRTASAGRPRVSVWSRMAECDVVTGALLDVGSRPAITYRPGGRLKALVRMRDGRCRFPGCSVAARFCDLDHVRPWPSGPTEAANLMCLCRRHHRVKQRAGWRVRLLPDARAVWTDPTGRVRTSWPRDLLDLVVLPAPCASSERQPTRPTSPRRSRCRKGLHRWKHSSVCSASTATGCTAHLGRGGPAPVVPLRGRPTSTSTRGVRSVDVVSGTWMTGLVTPAAPVREAAPDDAGSAPTPIHRPSDLPSRHAGRSGRLRPMCARHSRHTPPARAPRCARRALCSPRTAATIGGRFVLRRAPP